MKHQLALAAILLSCATSAFAQRNNNFNNRNNGNTNTRGGQNRNSGTLPLPEGVDRLISIDAYNTLLAESQDDDGQRVYTPIVVKHVYSGGIAALFGGSSIPTDQFVSPGSQNGGNGRNGGFGVSGFGGQGGIGGQGGFNQGGFNQGGFNQGGFNQGGFNQGGFQGGFNGGGFNQGFNGAGNGQLFQTQNGNFAMSQTSVVSPNGQQVPLANGPFFVR